jgi:hypothetical protein
MGDHIAGTAERKRVVSLVVGNRAHAQTKALGHEATRRLRPGHLPVIFTEASEG